MIFKNYLWPLVLLGAISSCSSSTPVSTPEIEDSVARKEAPEKSETPVIQPGPSNISASAFIDKTEEYGLAGISGTQFYAVDLNNNGHTDLVVLPDFFSVPDFYYFDPIKKKFIHDSVGALPAGLRASFLAFYDFDKDGVRDLVMATFNQRSAFEPSPALFFKGSLVNHKLVLTEVEQSLGVPGLPTSSLAILDFDLDGKLDIFLGNWVDNTKQLRRTIQDKLLKGREGLRFEDQTKILKGESEFDRGQNIYPNALPTAGATICDVDQNGLIDILTVSSGGESNRMWLNLNLQTTGQYFQDFAKESGYAHDEIGKWEPQSGGHSLFSLCTDYNNNGLMDIFISELTHSYDPESRDRSSVLSGSTFDFPPQFIRTPYEFDDGRASWTQAGRRGVFLDFNNDGLIDFLVDNSGFPPDTRMLVFQQNSDHSYEEKAAALGLDILNPSGTIVLDVNKDGRQDILTGQISVRDASIKQRVYLFENQIPREGRRSLRVFPKGTKGNAHALGAKIRLKSNQRSQTRMVSYSDGSTPSQNEEGISFGLDVNETPLQIEVTWPTPEARDRPLKALTRVYDLREKINFNEFIDLTVCENGSYRLGRKAKCPL